MCLKAASVTWWLGSELEHEALLRRFTKCLSYEVSPTARSAVRLQLCVRGATRGSASPTAVPPPRRCAPASAVRDARGTIARVRGTRAAERRAADAPSMRDARRSVVTNSLFGLGAPELVVILGLGAFVLGPDKLASMAKDFGKVAGELKDVPKEFKEGLEEGEAAKAARVLESGEKEEESA